MKKSKNVSGVLERKIKVNEVGILEIATVVEKVQGIWSKEEGSENIKVNVVEFAEKIQSLLLEFTDLKQEELRDLSLADLVTIWESFKEINTAFLQIALVAGLDLRKYRLPELDE